MDLIKFSAKVCDYVMMTSSVNSSAGDVMMTSSVNSSAGDVVMTSSVNSSAGVVMMTSSVNRVAGDVMRFLVLCSGLLCSGAEDNYGYDGQTTESSRTGCRFMYLTGNFV